MDEKVTHEQIYERLLAVEAKVDAIEKPPKRQNRLVLEYWTTYHQFDGSLSQIYSSSSDVVKHNSHRVCSRNVSSYLHSCYVYTKRHTENNVTKANTSDA